MGRHFGKYGERRTFSTDRSHGPAIPHHGIPETIFAYNTPLHLAAQEKRLLLTTKITTIGPFINIYHETCWGESGMIPRRLRFITTLNTLRHLAETRFPVRRFLRSFDYHAPRHLVHPVHHKLHFGNFCFHMAIPGQATSLVGLR